MFYITQSGKHDCAFVCLAMMLANYHHDRNYLFLQHVDKQYSFKELVDKAKEYNLHLLGVKVEDENEILKNDQFPIVVILKNEEDDSRHSVLLTKIKRSKVYIFDPVIGKRTMTLEDFYQSWTGEALIFSGISRTKCPIIPPDFIAKEDKILLPILQIISGLSLFVGTYFINQDSDIVLPIIFFGIFVIFEIMFRVSLIRAMRKMDTNIMQYSLNISKEEYFNFYSNTERYRYVSLSFFSNLVFSMMIVLFLTFILVLNSAYNIIYIIFAVGFAGIESLFYGPFYNDRSKDIEYDEKCLKEAENEEEFNFYAVEAREKAYQLSFSKTIINYLSIAFFLLLTVLLMSITGVISITYIVFYISVSLYLKTNFSKVFMYSKDSEQYDSLRLKIINSVKLTHSN